MRRACWLDSRTPPHMSLHRTCEAEVKEEKKSPLNTYQQAPSVDTTSGLQVETKASLRPHSERSPILEQSLLEILAVWPLASRSFSNQSENTCEPKQANLVRPVYKSPIQDWRPFLFSDHTRSRRKLAVLPYTQVCLCGPLETVLPPRIMIHASSTAYSATNHHPV